jgi:uncharacterized integral membrane protein
MLERYSVQLVYVSVTLTGLCTSTSTISHWFFHYGLSINFDRNHWKCIIFVIIIIIIIIIIVNNISSTSMCSCGSLHSCMLYTFLIFQWLLPPHHIQQTLKLQIRTFWYKSYSFQFSMNCYLLILFIRNLTILPATQFVWHQINEW